jgi:hypothetical protein
MSIYIKSTAKKSFVYNNKLVKCIDSFVKTGDIDKLYYYSIPYGLRKTIFKTLNIPIYNEDISDKSLYPFTKFISKNIDVSIGKKCFYIKLKHTDFERLSMVINFLHDHNKDYTIFIDSEFTNKDINFIQTILKKFPDKNIKFKLSELEFSYFQVKEIKDNTLYTETKCLSERLEIDLPPYFEKDLHFNIIREGNLIPDIDILKYYRIQDIRSGILAENAMFPRCIKENSVMILQ